MSRPFSLHGSVQLTEHDWVLLLRTTSNGEALLSALSSCAISAIDPQLLQVRRSFELAHTRQITDLQPFTLNPSLFATASQDGSARVWDLRSPSGGPQAEYRLTPNRTDAEVYSCSVGADDALLACGLGPEVKSFDLRTGKPVLTYESHSDIVNCVRFHPLERHVLLSAGDDNLICMNDTRVADEEEACVSVINNEDNVRGFTIIGPQAEVLCAISTTDDVTLWGLRGCNKIAELKTIRSHPLLQAEDSAGYIVDCFWEQTGQTLFVLAGSSFGHLLLFEATEAGAVPSVSFVNESALGTGHTAVVRSAVSCAGPEGAGAASLLTGGEDGLVCKWAPQKLMEPQQQQQPGGTEMATASGVSTSSPSGCLDLHNTHVSARIQNSRRQRAAGPY
uniref:Uncharacterized protein n=1 Tax=Chromera velia CCMP2878 TaxID=1169474 RepID=A0A0G4I5S7_9ALVE|eukprot:Cvel_11221.t1-p1 / transcript=Cvel_11221.t1 / gene=Cvel_11221 / organism=Chromera_velia_CCMP2878 / gene_product=WD repeat-containing protein 89 homolog, putative / transcript_product=WD repeat-containing protein 89 homolog, putative / location=Cvel_scaffold698:21449-23933(-) / protein_length=391 / sequence_SO=supercontig / SO=protein_coding / is_pseudo=false